MHACKFILHTIRHLSTTVEEFRTGRGKLDWKPLFYQKQLLQQIPPTSTSLVLSDEQTFSPVTALSFDTMSLWSVYKAKVLQTFGTESDGEMPEESDTSEIIENENQENDAEGLNMSHLARKVQGAFGWKGVSSLFFKDEEQRTDQVVEQQPEQVLEQSPSSRFQDNPSEKRSSALWSVFTNKWQQRSAERTEARGVLSEPPAEQNESDHAEETPFRWNFLTSKLAELRSKSD